MKTKAPIKIAIFYLFLIMIVVVVATSFALAFWGGNPTTQIAGSNSSEITNTNSMYKYMIFEALGLESGSCCYLRYSDSAYTNGSGTLIGGFVAYDLYGDLDSSITANSFTNVTLIGYTGTSGEYENMIIPSTISAYIQNVSTTFNVTEINLHSVEEFRSLKLITSVTIPSSIVAIRSVSFCSYSNLRSVYYNSQSLPATIEDTCFYDLNSVAYYKLNASSVYVEIE